MRRFLCSRTWCRITGSQMESQKKDTELHLFEKNRFGEIKSCKLRIHNTHPGFTQYQQGLQRGKKRQELENELLSCMAPLMDGGCNLLYSTILFQNTPFLAQNKYF